MSDEQAIRALVQTWVRASSEGDLDRVLALMSDDVLFHTPARAPFGKAEFAEAARASAGKVRAEGTAEVLEIQVSGDLACCRVRLHIRLTTPEGVEVKRLSGHAMSVLRKEGGRWLVARDANFVAPVKQEPNATVTTQLMFEGNAEEAMNLYISLFKGAQITSIKKYGPGEHGKEGTVMRAEFTLAGHRLACIDSPIKHAFTFTPSVSLFVECVDEAELDRAFATLSAGGAVLMPPDNYGFSSKFAWINDRFGMSWQLNLK
jgi:uncharacterized protein (TIGR02246 family)